MIKKSKTFAAAVLAAGATTNLDTFVPPFTDPSFARAAAEKSNASQAATRALRATDVCHGLPDNPYLSGRVFKLRQIVSRIEDKLFSEDDPQAASWWATALSRASDLERDLCGRPRAGTLKPSEEKVKGPKFGAPK